jgi:hypothetical protein
MGTSNLGIRVIQTSQLRPHLYTFIPGAGVGANGKNGGIFSTGEVVFLLTSPLMGDPHSLYRKLVSQDSTS